MSFSVQVLRNLSASNVVDKETNLLHTVEGELKSGTSLIDPVIIIQATAPGFHANRANYLYIEGFGGRYYYITNIISTNTTLWEIHAHVDVLMTYKALIREQTAIVARQERTYNLMLDDGIFMCYQDPKIQTKTFSVEGPFETQEFVLIVAGS